MSRTLDEIQRRVLGVLLEKSLAQPQYYPMTVNAIVVGCNQKSNRDPVLNLDEESVWNTLEVLCAAGLVSRLLPAGSSRVDRFRHEAKAFFGWEKPQRAVMAELLLRGPQTVGELRSRCSRLYPFDSTEAVAGALDNLRDADPPIVAPLPRGAGQSAVRYGHRLYTDDEWSDLTQPAGEMVGSTPGRPAEAPHAELDAIRAQVAELRQTLVDLGSRVEALERRWQ